MARPQKLGLDYFPLDVDIDQDDKIQLVEALHGTTGFAVVIKLLMRIYKEGYYYDWTEMEHLLFSRRVNVDINQLNDIVNDCVKYGLFDQKLYDKYQILTSHGIQERYFEASKRRKNITVVNQYMLINDSKIVNANINRVNVDINGEVVEGNVAESTQSKVKESKEENSKEQQTREEEKTPERKPVIVVDADFAKLTKFYAENIGPLNAAIADELNSMCELLNPELVLLALKESVLANAGNKIKYTHSILRSWKSQNFMTAADVEQHEKRKQQQTNQQRNYGRRSGGSAREDNIPEWFLAQKEEAARTAEQTEVVHDIEEKRKQVIANLEKLRRENA